MNGSPLRVVFAGLAHSHPYTDAANVLALGADVVGVHDSDPAAVEDFTGRYGGAAVASAADLSALDPDLVIATPRPHEVVPLLEVLGGAGIPVFVNKVIASTPAGLAEIDRVVAATSSPVGTSSVLRFAPALRALAAEVRAQKVLGLRVHAQHDNTGFQLPDRSWQDDPQRGGGTLVTVGIHAWEMLDVVLPGATLVEGTGWTRAYSGSETASEDAAGVDVRMRVPGMAREVPVQVLITGIRGADAYSVDVITATGIHSVRLDVEDANEALGFRGLAGALLDAAQRGATIAAWSQARAVVANSVGAAGIARGGA